MSFSIIFDTPFESSAEWTTNGNTSNSIWETNQYTPVLITNDSYQGSNCMQLSATSGSGDTRNEINANNLMSWGNEYWIGFAFKIVEEVPSSRLFMQIRQVPTNSTNPISLRIVNGQVRIDHTTDPALGDVTPGSGAGAGAEHTFFQHTLNQWHVFVAYFKPDYQNGDLKIWMDGDLLVEKINTTTVYRRNVEGTILNGTLYGKLGPYWANLAHEGIIRYDGYKVGQGAGGTYKDVHPLGLSPSGTVGGVIGSKRKNKKKKKKASNF